MALLLLWRRHVGLLFGKRLGTDLLRHRIKKNPDTCRRRLVVVGEQVECLCKKKKNESPGTTCSFEALTYCARFLPYPE